MTIKHK